jgi:glyoxylase-like metal-dependent hydrolase (beta-lactamase superfamily II)
VSSGAPELLDLMHLGRPRVIGAWSVQDVLIDPGPSSCLATLLPFLERRRPRAIALTHIHLDHAGATGSLLRRFPDLEVWVHERGAPHMIDPGRLLESARRLYGKDMERMWGEVAPVPAERVRALRGGETLGELRVLYTPGHASHHVTYLHEPTGTAFTCDVTGVRIGAGPVLAPTPPPDIDLRAWRDSLERVEERSPRRLAITHYGAHERPREHIAALREELDRVERLAGELDEAGFVAELEGRVGAARIAPDDSAYYQALPAGQSYQGLERYLRKAAERAA